MRRFLGTKLRVLSTEHAESFQKAALDAGCKWRYGIIGVSIVDYGFMLIDRGGHIRATNNEKYFYKSSYREIVFNAETGEITNAEQKAQEQTTIPVHPSGSDNKSGGGGGYMVVTPAAHKDEAEEAEELLDYLESMGKMDSNTSSKSINPSHYKQGKIECIDALKAATTNKSGIEAVCVANVIKYLWRYEAKNGLEDVKKAQWYLERLISELENAE